MRHLLLIAVLCAAAPAQDADPEPTVEPEVAEDTEAEAGADADADEESVGDAPDDEEVAGEDRTTSEDEEEGAVEVEDPPFVLPRADAIATEPILVFGPHGLARTSSDTIRMRPVSARTEHVSGDGPGTRQVLLPGSVRLGLATIDGDVAAVRLYPQTLRRSALPAMAEPDQPAVLLVETDKLAMLSDADLLALHEHMRVRPLNEESVPHYRFRVRAERIEGLEQHIVFDSGLFVYEYPGVAQFANAFNAPESFFLALVRPADADDPEPRRIVELLFWRGQETEELAAATEPDDH